MRNLEDRLIDAALKWGDFDGDRYLDIVITNGYGTDHAALYLNELNDGQRVFTPILPSRIDQYPFGFWADYDGDGKADIAVRRQDAGQFIIKYSSTGEIDRIFFHIRIGMPIHKTP